jgi:hypothetical protein
MADEFRIETNVEEFILRFKSILPDVTRREVEAGFRMYMGRLEEAVVDVIKAIFSREHEMERPDHIHLADAILATVMVEGDTFIGEIGYDLKAVPYARILEMGGTTRPHGIDPRLRPEMWFPASTLREELRETALYEWIRAFHVDHPGGYIAPYHFLLATVAAMAKSVEDDLDVAIARAMKQADLV